MKVFVHLVLAFLLFAVVSSCEEKHDFPNTGDDVIDVIDEINQSQIEVLLEDWALSQKSYSRGDLTTPEMSVGEKVAVIDSAGVVYCFVVVESENNKAILEHPEVQLQFNSPYRIQYPYPEVTNGIFDMSLGFGSYECTPTLDWMVSKWKKTKHDESFNFNLKHLNSALIVEIVSPFDCVVDEVRLSSKDSCIFCIKGAFDCSEDEIRPRATTWTNEFPFPDKGVEWVKGETYTLIITLWPYGYGYSDYSLDLYTTDMRGASAKIEIPDLKAGDLVEYYFAEEDFEILPEPVTKKEETQQEREWDAVM
jgi:hypothetical protein